MKRFLLLTLLLVTTSTATFANHLVLYPNDGSGDNFGFSGWMNGHPLQLSGGTDPFFFGLFGYDPGTTVGPYGGLFLYSTVIWIDNVPTEVFFPGAGLIYMSSITDPYQGIRLPTNGKDFRVEVIVDFSHTGIVFDTGQTISVGGGAKGFVTFYLGADGRYYPSSFAQVPEPATLVFVGTGLLSILGLARNRMRRF